VVSQMTPERSEFIRAHPRGGLHPQGRYFFNSYLTLIIFITKELRPSTKVRLTGCGHDLYKLVIKRSEMRPTDLHWQIKITSSFNSLYCGIKNSKTSLLYVGRLLHHDSGQACVCACIGQYGQYIDKTTCEQSITAILHLCRFVMLCEQNVTWFFNFPIWSPHLPL
jgi:hypothetical protein